MRFIYICLAFILLAVNPMTVWASNIGVGIAAAFGPTAYGPVMSFEYRERSPVSPGFRFETGVMLGKDVYGFKESGDTNIRIFLDLMPRLDFYLSHTGNVRPTIGAGLGVYFLGGIGANADGGGAGMFYGIAPQFGLEIGALRISITHNILLDGYGFDIPQEGGKRTIDQAYTSLEMSFAWGKVEKKKPSRKRRKKRKRERDREREIEQEEEKEKQDDDDDKTLLKET